MPTRTWLLIAGTALALVLGAAATKVATPRLGREPTVAAGETPAGPPTALLVAHAGWLAGAEAAERAGARCPEGRLVDAEVEALRMVLARAGYALYVADEPAELDPAEVTRHALVLHHDGGLGVPLPPAELEALRAARAKGVPLVLLGDDAAEGLAGAPDLLRDAGVERVLSGGVAPATLAGRVPFAYQGDPDAVALLPGADVRLAAADGAPVAWVAGRVGVVLASVRSSGACPTTDELGRVELEAVVAATVAAVTR